VNNILKGFINKRDGRIGDGVMVLSMPLECFDKCEGHKSRTGTLFSQPPPNGNDDRGRSRTVCLVPKEVHFACHAVTLGGNKLGRIGGRGSGKGIGKRARHPPKSVVCRRPWILHRGGHQPGLGTL